MTRRHFLLWIGLVLIVGTLAWFHRNILKPFRSLIQSEAVSINQDARSRHTYEQRFNSQESLEETCDEMQAFGIESKRFQLLVTLGSMQQALEYTLGHCRFERENIQEILLAQLVAHIEEEDTEASKLATRIARMSCDASPESIDQICTKRARDDQLDLLEWRTCTREAYLSLQTCIDETLKGHALDPTLVRKNYLESIAHEMPTLIDDIRNNKPTPDLETCLQKLEGWSQDRLLVESLNDNTAADLADRLFSLSFHLSPTSEPDELQRVNALIVFWARRFEMDYLTQQEDSAPFDSRFADPLPQPP